MGLIGSMLKLGWLESIPFEALLGHTITDIQLNDERDEILFTLAPHPEIPDGLRLKLFHYQDCCETVTVDDIAGDLDDLIGTPITLAEESTNSEDSTGIQNTEDLDSFTWTFYKLATVKGYVTIRWFGESNGYYSESVSLARIGKEDGG